MKMTGSKINPRILNYIVMVERGEIRACEEQHLVVKMVRRAFATEDIYTDEKLLEDYMRLMRYMPFEQFFAWEQFCLALHLCTFRRDGLPRWPDLFLLIGRGAGKDGYIAYEGMCLLSPYNGVENYDVDVCANSEKQAMRPVRDLVQAMGKPENTAKLQKHFRWTKETVTGRSSNSIMQGHTRNAKTKDGMRSGMVVFNEIHQYENYDNITVFTTGLGKRPHPRRLIATTNGDVRGGPLDDYIDTSQQILRGDIPDGGFLPFICKLDDPKEAHDPDNWGKPNPSLPFLPALREEVRKEYQEWKETPNRAPAFMARRMNMPEGNKELQVTTWANVLMTKREVPDLEGHPCVAGIDYMTTTDFLAVRLLFRVGEMRYSIGQAWMNTNSRDIPRIKYDWKKAIQEGLIIPVDDVEIHPDVVSEWIDLMGGRYEIRKIAIDHFRRALLAKSLEGVGFKALPRGEGNIKEVRPSDQMMVIPVIQSWFNNHQIAWGDDSFMRWCVSNTKLVQNSKMDKERGNYTYGKVEAKSRKNDGYMGFVHAACLDSELGDGLPVALPPTDFTAFAY